MAGEAALVARLEARMDKYEKAMKGAEETADRTVKGIENTFAATTIGTTLGNIISRGLLGAGDAIKQVFDEVVERIRKVADAADLAGVSMRKAFAIDVVLGPGGADALANVATQLDRMKRGDANSLSKILDANGVQNIKTAEQALTSVVDIIARLPTLVQAREAGALFGMGADTVERIRAVGGNFAKLRDQVANDLSPAMEDLAKKAKEFDAAWATATANFVTIFKAALVTAGSDLASFLSTMRESFSSDVQAMTARARQLREGLATEGAPDTIRLFGGGVKKELAEIEARLEAINKERGLPPGTRIGTESQNIPQPPPPSKPIPLGSAASAGTDRLDALEREQRRATERTAQMELEGKLIGQNVETRTRELEILRLTQMAEREKIPLTEAVRMKIDEQAEAYGRAAGKLDELMRKNQQSVQLQTFAGTMLVDTIMQATEAGAKFSDIMAGIAKQLARAALQALILGQGPLAGLFGTAPSAAGQTGGLIGSLVKALPKYQTGGVIPGSGPVPIMAHGGEVVVPKAVAQSMAAAPAGGGGSVIHIDARGAQAGVAEQIVAALKVYDAQQGRNLPGRMRTADMRFG
jgi:hypothetical protein